MATIFLDQLTGVDMLLNVMRNIPVECYIAIKPSLKIRQMVKLFPFTHLVVSFSVLDDLLMNDIYPSAAVFDIHGFGIQETIEKTPGKELQEKWKLYLRANKTNNLNFFVKGWQRHECEMYDLLFGEDIEIPKPLLSVGFTIPTGFSDENIVRIIKKHPELNIISIGVEDEISQQLADILHEHPWDGTQILHISDRVKLLDPSKIRPNNILFYGEISEQTKQRFSQHNIDNILPLEK